MTGADALIRDAATADGASQQGVEASGGRDRGDGRCEQARGTASRGRSRGATGGTERRAKRAREATRTPDAVRTGDG